MARLLRKLTVVAGAAGVAGRYAKNHPDKVNKWAEQAGQFIDKRTKGKFHNKITGAIQKVHSATEK